MTSDEVKIQLTAIRDNLPLQFSVSAARRLMSSYENYKHILQVLGQSYSSISAAVRAALPEIETAIRQAIKATPKKEAEEHFSQAKRRITQGIDSILLADAKKAE
ncbi:MAG TPA: hypothetical protein VGM89_06230 [Puia sp.]